MRKIHGQVFTLLTVAILATPVWGQPRLQQEKNPQQNQQQKDKRQRGGGRSFDWLLKKYDTNNDGKVTKEEFTGPEKFFKRFDSDGDGTIDQKELGNRNGGANRGKAMQNKGNEGKENSAMASRLKRYEVFPKVKPVPGDLAPDFELRDLKGNTVKLSELLKTKPVVIETGSCTCPVFRGRHGSIEALYQEFGDKVHLIVLYGKEAHPESKQFKEIKQPRKNDERIKVARKAAKDLSIGVPVVVDDVDNKVTMAYGGLPNCGYIIGQDQRVFYKLSWIHPTLMRAPLEAIIKQGGSGGAKPKSFPVGGNHPSESGQAREVPSHDVKQTDYKNAPIVVGKEQENKIAWAGVTLEKANLLAKKAGVPVLAEFHFEGCFVCAAMEKGPLRDPQVVALSRKYVSVKIDLTSEVGKKLGEKYGVIGTPTFVLFNSTGEVIAQREGHAEPNVIADFFEQGLVKIDAKKRNKKN